MAREKKSVHHVQMTDGKHQIIQQLLQEYDIQSAADIQYALKDLLGGTIKEMMEAEMDDQRTVKSFADHVTFLDLQRMYIHNKQQPPTLIGTQTKRRKQK